MTATDPPPPPLPAPPRPRAGIPVWAIFLIVAAVLGMLAIGVMFAIGFTTGLQSALRGPGEQMARETCIGRLATVAGAWSADREADRTSPRSGPAAFLELRKLGRIPGPYAEENLLCPNDPDAPNPRLAGATEDWDEVDLDRPLRPGLCSYAVRDFAAFPLAAGAAGPEPIAACLHHPETAQLRGGANVAYTDGNARWLGFEELGISDGTELVAGPASKSPLLRRMVAPPATPAGASGR